MSLLPTPGSFFSLEAGQAQVWRPCGVKPNNWQSDQETVETPMSTRMLEGRPGNGKLWAHLLICGAWKLPIWSWGGCPLMGSLKVAGVILGWPSTCLWGPVVVVDEWGPRREYRELTDTLRLLGRCRLLLQWDKSGGWLWAGCCFFCVQKVEEAELTA